MIEITNGVVATDSEEAFFKLVGGNFETRVWGKTLEEVRRLLPRDVGCVGLQEPGKKNSFASVYLTYCRRGLVYVYKAF